MKKRVQVYDRVNRERLLGTMDRWSAPRDATHYRALCCPGPVSAMDCRIMPPEMSVDTVTLERVMKLNKDGWDAEVIVVTDAPLSALVRLKDFRPAFGYDIYAGPDRDYYYRTYAC